jgi:hypothetical protein
MACFDEIFEHGLRMQDDRQFRFLERSFCFERDESIDTAVDLVCGNVFDFVHEIVLSHQQEPIQTGESRPGSKAGRVRFSARRQPLSTRHDDRLFAPGAGTQLLDDGRRGCLS